MSILLSLSIDTILSYLSKENNLTNNFKQEQVASISAQNSEEEVRGQ